MAPEFATLESLKELTETTKIVEKEGVGAFELGLVSVQEFLDMQKTTTDDDGVVDEWEATKLLLSTAVLNPPLADDEVLLGSLPIGVTKWLTEEIAKFAGIDQDFGDGSPTG